MELMGLAWLQAAKRTWLEHGHGSVPPGWLAWALTQSWRGSEQKGRYIELLTTAKTYQSTHLSSWNSNKMVFIHYGAFYIFEYFILFFPSILSVAW